MRISSSHLPRLVDPKAPGYRPLASGLQLSLDACTVSLHEPFWCLVREAPVQPPAVPAIYLASGRINKSLKRAAVPIAGPASCWL